MAVTKHDIEWLVQTLELHEQKLPTDLVDEARGLIAQSRYRKSVCVIHPVDETDYLQLRRAILRQMNAG